MMAGAWLLDRYLWKYGGFLVRGRIFPMVVNFGLGKEVIAVASAVEKGNQQPAMRHKNRQKDRQCSGYLFGGYGWLL